MKKLVLMLCLFAGMCKMNAQADMSWMFTSYEYQPINVPVEPMQISPTVPYIPAYPVNTYPISTTNDQARKQVIGVYYNTIRGEYMPINLIIEGNKVVSWRKPQNTSSTKCYTVYHRSTGDMRNFFDYSVSLTCVGNVYFSL